MFLSIIALVSVLFGFHPADSGGAVPVATTVLHPADSGGAVPVKGTQPDDSGGAVPVK